jgi:tetratricopeptide (TPR) repeat protein
MRQLYFFILIFVSTYSLSQEAKIDSLSTLIDNTNNPIEKAKLLLKRSKAYPLIKTTEPKNDAIIALDLAKKANDYKIQIEALNQISGVNFRENKYEEALVNDSDALALAIKNDDALGQVTTYKSIGRNLKSLGRIEEAIQKTVLAKDIAVAENLTQEYANVNNALGVLYRVNGEFEKSLEVFNDALKQTKNTRVLALIYMNKGNTLSELMRLDEAADNYFAGLKINENINDEKGRLQSYNNLSVLFKKAKRYEKAIYYAKQSLEISKKNGVKNSMAVSYDNLANFYDLTNKSDSIVWYRKEAIKLFDEVNDEKNLARCHHNLGHYYMLHNNLSEAKKYLNKALEKRLKIKNSIDIASTQTSLGIIADKEKDYSLAEDYLLKAKELVKNEKTENKAFLLNALSDHYKMKGDLENALIEKQAAMNLKDSLLQSDEVVEVLSKNHEYQIDKKNEEIQNAESFKSKYNNNRLVFAVLLFCVFLIALYSFVRWKKLDFKKKQLLLEKSKIEEKHELTLAELETERKKTIIDHIILKNKTKIILDDLYYIRSDDHYLEFITKLKKEINRGSLKQLENQLPSNFFRCHKSYIVNTNYIKSNNVKEIIMANNDVIPISRNYKMDL